MCKYTYIHIYTFTLCSSIHISQGAGTNYFLGGVLCCLIFFFFDVQYVREYERRYRLPSLGPLKQTTLH